MRFALSSGSLYTYGLDRVFGLAAEAGFDGVEVLVDYRFDTRQPDYLGRLMERHKMPILSVHAPFRPERLSDWPNTQAESVAAAAELARTVGADIVVVHLPRRGERAFARWLKHELAAWQQAQPLPRIAVENMPIKWLRYWPFTPVEAWQMNQLDKWGTFPYLTMDTTHLGTKGEDVLSVYQQLRERIVHVHLSNARRAKRRVLEHRRLEDGFLPLGKLIGQLSRDGYNGIVTIELVPHALDAAKEYLVRRHLRRQVAFCRRHL